jgi:hypothetical protein
MLTPSESDGTKSGSVTPEPELESYHPFPPPSHLSSPDVAALLVLDIVQILSKKLRRCLGTRMVRARLQKERKDQRDGFIPFVR